MAAYRRTVDNNYLEFTNCFLDMDKTIDWVFALEVNGSKFSSQDEFYSSLQEFSEKLGEEVATLSKKALEAKNKELFISVAGEKLKNRAEHVGAGKVYAVACLIKQAYYQRDDELLFTFYPSLVESIIEFKLVAEQVFQAASVNQHISGFLTTR